KKKTTAPQQCKTSAPGLELYLSYLRLVAPPPLADFVSEQRGGVTLPPSVFKVHPINKTEDSVINATYCTLSGQNPDSRSRIIALHGALNKQPLKKWDTITGRWSTRCGESRCRHDTVQRGAVGAHL